MGLRVVLVEQSIRHAVRDEIGLSTGLLTIASHLRRQLADVEISFLSLRLDQLRRQAVDLHTVWRRLEKLGPDVVGVGSWTCNFLDALVIAACAKRMGAIVVMGGLFPSMNDARIAGAFPEIDFLVRGEGEGTFADLCCALATGEDPRTVAGLTYRDGPELIRTPTRSPIDLRELVLPAYDLIPMEEYRGVRTAPGLFTSRGCPFDCVFCTLRDSWGGLYRRRPIADIAAELSYLTFGMGFDHIRVEDDAFTVDRHHTLEVCRILTQVGFDATYMVKTRVDLLDEHIMDVMFDAGVREVLLGVETVNPSALTSLRKTKSPDDWQRLAHRALSAGVRVGLQMTPVFMLGTPGETPGTLANLEDFIVDLYSETGTKPYLAFATPHPGSRLWAQRDQLGIAVLTQDLARYTHLQPVAVPSSLGKRGLKLLCDSYDRISTATDSRQANPEQDGGFLERMRSVPDTSDWVDTTRSELQRLIGVEKTKW